MVLGIGVMAARAEQVFSSGERAVPLIELFTSEGCSSCPPAERWMGTLKDDPQLWQDFVPVAWHVNYWDRLGWPDKFASSAYTDRQYAYAKSWSSRQVYTPGFVRGGEEWRPRAGAFKRDARSPLVGELTATISSDQVRVEFAGKKGEGMSSRWVNVVRLGGGIVSDVRKGENRDKQLEHEFLALGWERVLLRDGAAVVTLPPSLSGVKATREAVVVWVSSPDSPAPIQATGGWIN